MRFASPEWFLLIPLLLTAGWFWRGWQLWRPLRIACLAIVVLLAVRPEIRRSSDSLDLWVLVDRSESAADRLAPLLSEWETILDRSKGRDDRLIFVDFADEAVRRGAQMRTGRDALTFAGSRKSTRLNSAIRHAVANVGDDRATRVLALTDGYSTEPLAGLDEALASSGAVLDYRLPGDASGADFRVASMSLPQRVQPGEAFLAEVVVAGPGSGAVPLEIYRNGQSIGRRDVPMDGGVGRLRFTDRPTSAGAIEYAVRLRPESDVHAGNNAASRWIEVHGGPRVLLLTSYTGDPLAAALRAHGFEVAEFAGDAVPGEGALTGAEMVFFNNRPAHNVPADFVRALDFFVQHQGGGLAMIGGKSSFGSGGWFESPLDPLLPVSMELKQEHRKLAVAMAIVMDRSGSMAMTAPGTSIPKMALANEGAARTADLLGDNDMLSVFAVDSEAHVISPLVAVGPNRDTLRSVIRRVESMGGGIFVYTGLKAAWDELRKAEVGQRHIILFSDAADSEEPGDYIALLAEMQQENATVSVIGLGGPDDSDAAFLMDVALRGGGRMFFNSNPADLPALFAQETVSVARSAFLAEPVDVNGTPGWMEIAAGAPDWPAQVDGYNLTYLRPDATASAVSGDEYAAPLVATWQRGTGRVAAVGFPMGGEVSERTRAWPGYGGFVATLARWLSGESTPDGIGLRTAVDGNRLRVDLFHDDSWQDRVNDDPPELVLAEGAGGAAQAVTWERLEPGRFRAELDLDADTWLRGAVRIGNTALPFGPVNPVTNAEWDFDPARLQELRELSRRSGGSERVDLSDVWHAPRPPAWSPVHRILLPALLVALLLEAWQTRAGWAFRRPRQSPPA